MKRLLLPLSLLLGTAVFTSCGGGSETETESDTTTTTTTTTDTSTLGNTTTGTTGTTYSATPLTGQDTTFAKEAASGGLMEVELGNLAQQNAASDRVKAFGQMMVRDHSAANNELKSLASAKNMMLSDSMMKKHRDHVESMRKMNGKSFDNHYMQMMVKDHNEDVQKFEKASTGSTDADLKAWAGKTLPILRMHLDSAKAINKAKM
jgi:putative membrane protein